MPAFLKGRTLCRRFFQQAAKPILDLFFPGLTYTAGLLGYGSDVLGYDDETSTDHMWGPRFYLFLSHADIDKKESILRTLSEHLPLTFLGYSVNFSAPDENDGGVRHPEFITSGPCSALLFIYTPGDYLQSYLGVQDPHALSDRDWLTLSEHRLLGLSRAEFYVDGLSMASLLEPLKAYPDTVRRYLIASHWAMIAQEQAFVRRCAEVGDELGSILICARMTEQLMRLGFVYSGIFAPYSKWFGTAFARLPLEGSLKRAILDAAVACTITAREDALLTAQVLMAEVHNHSALCTPVDIAVEHYFGRSSRVIRAEKLADSAQKLLRGTSLENAPLIGTMSGVANFTDLSDEPRLRGNLCPLYDGPNGPEGELLV